MERWLTLNEVAGATGVAPDVIRTGIKSGLFDGWIKTTGKAVQFRPGTADFVRWSDKVCDMMLAGIITEYEAQRLIRRRARCLVGLRSAPLFEPASKAAP